MSAYGIEMRDRASNTDVLMISPEPPNNLSNHHHHSPHRHQRVGSIPNGQATFIGKLAN